MLEFLFQPMSLSLFGFLLGSVFGLSVTELLFLPRFKPFVYRGVEYPPVLSGDEYPYLLEARAIQECVDGVDMRKACPLLWFVSRVIAEFSFFGVIVLSILVFPLMRFLMAVIPIEEEEAK